jgi:RNA polymerase sigma-70 factor (ECF subfamily)
MTDALTAALATNLDATFEQLVLAHQDRLYSIALRLLRNPADAEEVAQDAFVRAYRALETYDRERIRHLELRPWLATILVNLCRNRARRRPPPTTVLEHGADPEARSADPKLVALDPRESPHEAALRREAAEQWASLLAELPDRYRIPVVLRHVDGLSYDEMAVVLGRPTGTIKAQVHRGLARLRTAAERAALVSAERMTA